ncbi:MAG TPA: energy transducer TonB [Bryobacteraceae bacterium]|jgi:TonB family protein
MPGADLLDQRDPLGKFFTGSLFFHGSLLALILLWPHLVPKTVLLGDPTHHSGTIGVSVVKTIPIPQREGPVNRLANDSQTVAPQKPEPKPVPKPVVKEKIPVDAIPIPDKKTKPKHRETEARNTTPYHSEEPLKKNQIFSDTPQSLKSPEMGIQGTNGIGVGPSNPFGEQFGWYAQQIFDRVGQKWNRADVSAGRNQRAIVRFTLQRDGSVQNVKLVQPSGSYTLDLSAQRAIMDAVPLPQFPRGFNYNSINVDLTFELHQ